MLAHCGPEREQNVLSRIESNGNELTGGSALTMHARSFTLRRIATRTAQSQITQAANPSAVDVKIASRLVPVFLAAFAALHKFAALGRLIELTPGREFELTNWFAKQQKPLACAQGRVPPGWCREGGGEGHLQR